MIESPSHVVAEHEDRSPTGVLEVLVEEARAIHGSSFAWPPPDGPADMHAFASAIAALEGDDERTALCLSGGGIRSATFCLGVLQALARKHVLRRIHYLSTVSGGGYIGSWLSTWIAREESALRVEKELGDETLEAKPVRHLRRYSSYLAPKAGLSTDLFTLAGIVVRNLLLNWLVLVPLLVALLLLPRIFIHGVQWATALGGDIERLAVWLLGLGMLSGSAFVAFIWRNVPRSRSKASKSGASAPFVFLLPAVAVALALAAPVLTSRYEQAPQWQWYAGAAGAAACVALLGLVVERLWPGRRDAVAPTICALALVSAAAGGGVLAIVARAVGPDPEAAPGAYTVLAWPLVLGVYWLGVTVWVGVVGRYVHEEAREWWAWTGALSLRPVLAWIAGSAIVIYGPILPAKTGAEVAALITAAGGLGGVIAALVGFWGRGGLDEPSEETSWLSARLRRNLLPLCAAAFIVTLLVVLSSLTTLAVAPIEFDASFRKNALHDIAARSYLHEADRVAEYEAHVDLDDNSPIGDAAKQATRDAASRNVSTVLKLGSSLLFGIARIGDFHEAVLFDDSRPHNELMLRRLAVALAVLVGVALFVSLRIGVNTFSLHGMYGNRLVRAYLGASNERNPSKMTNFDANDNMQVSELRTSAPHAPFHVFNLALNLTRGRYPQWQQRKAASFTVTPLHSGSPVTGYHDSSSYAGPRGISVGKAMAISGAAVSPAMGYHSSRPVSWVMTFFNARLGWWLPNPRLGEASGGDRRDPMLGIPLLLQELLGTVSDDSKWIYTSDGGHFDNLGLYEMVRRRCRRIVVVDATCDPRFQYDDLARCVRMIRADLGIEIELEELPGGDRPRRWACGRIRYSSVDRTATDGTLVYLKPILLGDEPVDVARYAQLRTRADSGFPHESTSDQFFDEAQFESYRRLGLLTAQELLASSDDPFVERAPASTEPFGAARHPLPLPAVRGEGEESSQGAPGPVAQPIGPAGKRGGATSGGWLTRLWDRGADLIAPVAASTVAAATVVTGTIVLSNDTLHLQAPKLQLAENQTVLLSTKNLIVEDDKAKLPVSIQTPVDPIPVSVRLAAFGIGEVDEAAAPPPPFGTLALKVSVEPKDAALVEGLGRLADPKTANKELKVVVTSDTQSDAVLEGIKSVMTTQPKDTTHTIEHQLTVSVTNMEELAQLIEQLKKASIRIEDLDDLEEGMREMGRQFTKAIDQLELIEDQVRKAHPRHVVQGVDQ